MKKQQNFRFVFNYVCVKVTVHNNAYDVKELQQLLSICTKSINIDKSYVDYKGTKYEKTFMTEDGWNSLCKLVAATNYGDTCTREENAILLEAYSMMIICYLYQLLEDMDYDCSEIHLELQEKSAFMAQIFSDNTRSVDSYIGKWQTWNVNK